MNDTQKRKDECVEFLDSVYEFLSIQFPELDKEGADAVPRLMHLIETVVEGRDQLNRTQRVALVGRIFVGCAKFWLTERLVLSDEDIVCSKCGVPIFKIASFKLADPLRGPVCVECAAERNV